MKTAIVLFASTPLLGQAGISVESNPEKALALYSIYMRELLRQFYAQNDMDVFLCCEEKYQAALISNHFTPPKDCLI